MGVPEEPPETFAPLFRKIGSVHFQPRVKYRPYSHVTAEYIETHTKAVHR